MKKRILSFLAVALMPSAASAGGCFPEGRADLVSLLMARPMMRAATPGFGAYESSDAAREGRVRVAVSQPRLIHSTSDSRLRALVIVRELHAASAPELRCRAVVIEADGEGANPRWSRLVAESGPDPRYCGEPVLSGGDRSGHVILSACTAPDGKSRILSAVRLEETLPVLGSSTVEPGCRSGSGALLVLAEDGQVQGALATYSPTDRPAWDHELMASIERDADFAGLQGEFDVTLRERVFTIEDNATFIALQDSLRRMGLSVHGRVFVNIGDDGMNANARYVVGVME